MSTNTSTPRSGYLADTEVSPGADAKPTRETSGNESTFIYQN